MPIINSRFRPAWWLPGPHLQTLWPTFFRTQPTIALQRERIELADGDFVEISSTSRNHSPRILLLHGLEGSLASHYARPLISSLDAAGYAVSFMHLRGCSEEPNRLARSYHSGETADLQAVINHLKSTHDEAVFAVIGISLGGNITLKWLGEQGEQAATTCAIAVSVPFQLDHAALRLERGFSRIYQKHLLDKCQTRYQHKFSTRPSPLTVDVEKLVTFYDFDDKVTAPLNEFSSADDYYRQCSSRQYLRRIRRPTLILHSRDDPFMFQETPPQEDELAPPVELELTENGGHVGFVSGNVPGMAEYWLDRRIIEWLELQRQQAEPASSDYSGK